MFFKQKNASKLEVTPSVDAKISQKLQLHELPKQQQIAIKGGDGGNGNNIIITGDVVINKP